MTYRWALRCIVAAGLLLGLCYMGHRGLSQTLAAESKDTGQKPETSKLPPLVIDKSAPLLLDAPSEKLTGLEKDPLSINTACFVCHNNYTTESLVKAHAKEKVGCIDCHGQSFAHRDDEDNVTPPDIIYPLEKIEAACQKCHDTHDAPAKKVLKRWQERCPSKHDFASVVCTDCHGEHRLEKRVVRWDKNTRALILSAKTTPTSAGAKATPAPEK